jgi:hypothetical protein
MDLEKLDQLTKKEKHRTNKREENGRKEWFKSRAFLDLHIFFLEIWEYKTYMHARII